MPRFRDAHECFTYHTERLGMMVSRLVLVTFAVTLLMSGCGSSRTPPTIEFTAVPEAGPGRPARTERISGKVHRASRKQRIVLFARSGTWWVQPLAQNPFTPIRRDSTWEALTHIGTDYAALLVNDGYTPPKTTDVLPATGTGILAVSTIEGRRSAAAPLLEPRWLHFSGYDWEIRQIPSDSGGVMHINSASNVWTDPKGQLHLRIARSGDQWTCAEISLTRSLGYGTYTFHFGKLPVLEPASVLGMFTWDEPEGGQSHREIDIELSQWGDPMAKNAQFVIQPYFVAANVFRFDSTAVPITYSCRWEPGSATFRAIERLGQGPGRGRAEHVFTSGVPSPAGETVHINLYTYGKSRTQQQQGVEVVMEKFEFLP
jgi:hypothetical protein